MVIKGNNLDMILCEESNIIKWIEQYTGELSAEEKNKIILLQKKILDGGLLESENKFTNNNLHDKNKRKELGIAYTPREVRLQLVSDCLDFLDLNHPNEIKNCQISDPCCGSGLFIVTLLEELEKRGVEIQYALQHVLHMSDVDRLSVAVSILQIINYASLKDVDISDIQINAKVSDFLSSNDTYDAIITNPPYVKTQNLSLEYRSELKKNFGDFSFGSLGLSGFFLKKIYDSLSPNGITGIITQNNIFTSNAAKPLRRLIQRHLHKIETFGSHPKFNDVSTYTCLIYLSKEETSKFEYVRVNNNDESLSVRDSLNTAELDYSKWRLGSQKELRDLRKIEQIGIPLGVACRIWVGIATQFDKAYTVKLESGEWISTCPNGAKISIEPEIVKKLLKISNIKSESQMSSNQAGVIYPYEIHGGRAIPYDEKAFALQYPKAYFALSEWKKKLLQRDKGRIDPARWFEWGRVQSMIPVKNKLVTKTFDRGPNFYFDTSDSLFSNGYALTPRDASYEIEFIQRLLNSRLFFYYAKLTSFEIEGEYQCYQKNFIESFCLPMISSDEQRELLEIKEFEDFLSDYYDVIIPEELSS